MRKFYGYQEAFLNFLLMRLDERDFATLVTHEPKTLLTHEPKWMTAPYLETGGGRCETRSTDFAGCVSCSQVGLLECGGFLALDIAAWPCGYVRHLALKFADDPEFNEGWRPEYAGFVSGKLLHDS